jgi:hypothetical protein
MSFDQGKLKPRPERYTVNTHDKPNRVSTMVIVAPEEKFVFIGTTSAAMPSSQAECSLRVCLVRQQKADALFC